MRFVHAPHVLVNLVVDGIPLQELENTDEQDDSEPVTTSVTRYVESTPGKSFTVSITLEPGFALKDTVVCHVIINGQWAAGQTCDKANVGFATVLYGGKSGDGLGNYIFKQFVFAELSTDDGPSGETALKTYKNLGTIEVALHHARKVGSYHPHGSPGSQLQSHNEKIPEKALKGRAISNQATLGKPQTTAAFQYVKLEYPFGLAFAQAIFMYRSHKDLQIEGLIPRSPSPVALEDRDPDDLSPEEARQLVRQLREKHALQADIIKRDIKKEKRAHSQDIDDDDDDDTLEVVATGSKRRRATPGSAVEILDLTED